MIVIKREQVEFLFTDIKVNLKADFDINTTDILFVDSDDTNKVFEVLNNHRAFDGDYNIVIKRFSNTIRLTGEIVVRCLHNNLLDIVVFY